MTEPSESDPLTPETVTARVMSLYDRRLSSAQELAQNVVALREAEQTLEAARRAYSDAWKRAKKNGPWKDEELTRELGLPAPNSRARKRRPRRPQTDNPEVVEQEESSQ